MKNFWRQCYIISFSSQPEGHLPVLYSSNKELTENYMDRFSYYPFSPPPPATVSHKGTDWTARKQEILVAECSRHNKKINFNVFQYIWLFIKKEFCFRTKSQTLIYTSFPFTYYHQSFIIKHCTCSVVVLTSVSKFLQMRQ